MEIIREFVFLKNFFVMSILLGMIHVHIMRLKGSGFPDTFFFSSHSLDSSEFLSRGAAEMNPAKNHEVAGSIPGLAQ